MEEMKTGGPAFPTFQQNAMNGHAIDEMAGMTLRDYFAAKAMQGWIAGQPMVDTDVLDGSENHAEAIASAAYVYADAMLEARKK